MAADKVSLDLRTPVIKSEMPAKATIFQPLEVICDAFSMPSNPLRAVLVYEEGGSLMRVPLLEVGDDAFSATFIPKTLGEHRLRVLVWEDLFRKSVQSLQRRVGAKVAELVDFEDVVSEAALRCKNLGKVNSSSKLYKEIFPTLKSLLKEVTDGPLKTISESLDSLVERRYEIEAFSDEARKLLRLLNDEDLLDVCCVPLRRDDVTELSFEVFVERERSTFGFWYELFPRSVGGFKGVVEVLPHLVDLGVDVLYLPPIHPIGVTGRKGKNNSLVAQEHEVGSPWAIGSQLGGHDSIDPSLGGFQEFSEMIEAAGRFGVEIALDLALQCSPDHPWVSEHPEWFIHRSNGTIAFAENPPKRYEDIVPINFFPSKENDRVALWREILRVVTFWIDRGVRTFRVDNPHTKPISFWKWLISTVRKEYLDVVFLAEAFTRPKIMYKLAQVGFSQSYTYFTWRNSPIEISSYVKELYSKEICAYFRPNFWPNTPDILSGSLRWGSRSEFELRLVLASTLSPSYGIYSGYEFLENEPFSFDSEEYQNSEKYEIKVRDYEIGGALDSLISKINNFRRSHLAMQRIANVEFLPVDGESLLAFLRFAPECDDYVLVVCNFNTKSVSEGALYLPELLPGGKVLEEAYGFDSLTGEHYTFRKGHNFIRLDPARTPGHLVSLTFRE